MYNTILYIYIKNKIKKVLDDKFKKILYKYNILKNYIKISQIFINILFTYI